MLNEEQIRKYLELSIDLAKEGFEKDNYPIGSIIVNSQGNIIAKGFNENTTQKDITAHAEILCIRQSGLALSKDATGENILFTSLEPCFGCSFFIARTNIKKIYWALEDPHRGGIGDLKSEIMFKDFFPNIELVSEPYEDLKGQSKDLMRKFFLAKGNAKTANLYS
ncbi:MAG: nucleoside deaminase [Candidatus Shapirobacteria bacterium]|jgi:tRNA(adenine34) deaminase